MTTDERLAAIAARVGAATEGPWHADLLLDFADTTEIVEPEFGWLGTIPRDLNVPQEQIHADAIFMAEAREDIPFLLDLVRRLRAELAARAPQPLETTTGDALSTVDTH